MWGNFVRYADNDLLSFAVLWECRLRVPSYYHATQALEKYLKALALALDQSVGPANVAQTKWVRTHNLVELADRCKKQFPFYGEHLVRTKLEKFTEFDQLARYPWVKQQHGDGFTSADLPIYWQIAKRLRNDIPITQDDYPLGLGVRQAFHRRPKDALNDHILAELNPGVSALRALFGDVETMVRW